MKWKPYPSYKPSGVEWLGDVPVHWEVLRLRRRLRAIEQGWSPECEARLADDEEWGVLKVGCVNGASFNASEHKALPAALEPLPEFEVRPGDLLMSRANTAELLGNAVLVRDTRPRLLLCDKLYRLHTTDVDKEFLAIALKARPARFLYERDATGSSASMKNIGQDTVREMVLAFPPLSEQAAIARQVAVETARLDALVAKKRALVERLHEKRTALISRTVTRGLPPEAARAAGLAPHPNLEPSGIPERWRESPLMHLVEPRRPIMYGIVLPGPDVDEGVLIVKGGDVKPGRLTPESLCRTTIEIAAGYERSRLRAGDLLFSIRGTVGEVEMVPAGIDGANITQDVARIAPAAEVNRRWLLHALKAEAVVGPLLALSLGAAVRGVNIRDLKHVRIPVPPVPEQQAIAEYLDRETARIDRLVEKVEAAIERLQEYRQALITAAVTGKIDVRDKAPGPAAA